MSKIELVSYMTKMPRPIRQIETRHSSIAQEDTNYEESHIGRTADIVKHNHYFLPFRCSR